jgi:hypothetical protein
MTQKMLCICYAVVAISLSASIGFADTADTLLFSLIPSNGNVSGPPGSTVGWGYSITNESATNWLLTSGLSAGSFTFGTPNLLFDFPVLAPGGTATEAFDAVNGTGLYELTWDATAPNEYANFGLFTLGAEWWSGDPFNGGSFIQVAPDSVQAYSASVSTVPEPVPEPSALVLMLCALGVVGVILYQSKKDTRPTSVTLLFAKSLCTTFKGFLSPTEGLGTRTQSRILPGRRG